MTRQERDQLCKIFANNNLISMYTIELKAGKSRKKFLDKIEKTSYDVYDIVMKMLNKDCRKCSKHKKNCGLGST